MPLRSPLSLSALLLGGLAPFFVYGTLMDAGWYWEMDLNGLLFLRSSIHGAAYLLGLSTVAWMSVPRDPGGKLDRALQGLFDGALASGFLTVPIPFFAGCASLLEAFAGMEDGWSGTLRLLHPVGYALVFVQWMRCKRPENFSKRLIALSLIPLGLLMSLQVALWKAESRCFEILERGEPNYAERIERFRPAAGILNLDPLLMKYLRESGFLSVRSIPDTIPATTPLAERIATAWRILRQADIATLARERFVLLLRSKGHDEERSAQREP